MQGSINLKTCSEIKMIGVYKKKKDCFTIVTPSKTYFLYGCEGDSESWVKALNDAKGSVHRLQFNPVFPLMFLRRWRRHEASRDSSNWRRH